MSGSGAKVLVEGFAADAHVARDGRLAFTGGNAAVQIGNHLIRERPFPPPIGAALPSDRNAFALPFADRRDDQRGRMLETASLSLLPPPPPRRRFVT